MPQITRKRVIFIQTVFLIVIAAAFTVSSVLLVRSVEQMLDRDAQAAARQWADAFAVQTPAIENILRGEYPTPEQIRVFEDIATIGEVFRFKLFDAEGRLRLISDEMKDTRTADDTLLDHQSEIALSILAGETYTVVKEGNGQPNRPEIYAEAYVPFIQDGEVKGVIEVYLDETERRAGYGATLYTIIWFSIGLTVVALLQTLYTAFLQKRERHSDERARHLASHDALTGLANRTVFRTALKTALRTAHLPRHDVAVHMIDLDGFKIVNDRLGHVAGDELLREVAIRLTNAANVECTVARLGGDEFAIVQPDLNSRESALALARRVVEGVRELHHVHGCDVQISTSVGIAFASHQGEGSELSDILKHADAALYCAKEAGRDRYIPYEAGMQDARAAYQRLRSHVRWAVENRAFEVAFQPQHDASDGNVCGFEALLRLPDGNGGYITPDDFIPIAENMQLMPALGEIVLYVACAHAAQWPQDIKVSVNLSAQQFQEELVATVGDCLARTGLKSQRLELEITESLFIGDGDIPAVRKQLDELKALGVSIAMDDFGTGYSSLSYLWHFPFDKLKVDRSCFQNLGQNDNVARVLTTIGSMGQSMKLRLTAEGVETEAQLAFARQAGFQEIQGFYYSRPIPVDEINGYILRNRAAIMKAADASDDVANPANTRELTA
ncbi:putative bifunctional diguanylate cyclase/phosphodiesterase [Tepidamorphus sp. 3E244]|uniref:putative bifunctional diguanylate cyclase/phosphodiesterase n=1 Tax=Tepidamorphus sp. 3E244 TaxID=3385498 RepID=UPI0038FC3080